jgi:hypothetical protein
MGNFYEMIGKMKTGDVITPTDKTFVADIKKIDGGFKYVSRETGQVHHLFGKDGWLIHMDNMDTYTWEIKELGHVYVKITDLNEVRDLLKAGKTLYTDEDKTEIRRFTDVKEADISDFDDTFILTSYYKNVNE